MSAPRTRTPEREQRVLDLLADGKFNAEIAHEVGHPVAQVGHFEIQVRPEDKVDCMACAALAKEESK